MLLAETIDKARRARPGSARELLWVALPLVISSGSASIQYVLDRIFLTWYSTDALAASLPAGMLHWTLLSLAIGTAGYVNTFVAQYEGAGERHRIGAVLWHGLYFSFFASLLLLAAVPAAPWIFDLFGHNPFIRRLETEYFSVLCYGAFPLLVQTTLACFYSGRGHTLIIMAVNLAMTLINALLDYALIFGAGGWPRMGIAGAATATVIAWTAGALMYAAALAGKHAHDEYRLAAGWRFDRALWARLMRFGLPNGVQSLIDVAAWSVFIQMIGRLGSTQLAATSLAFNLNTLAFIPLVGMGTAVMTLTGQRVGAGQPELAVRTTWLAYWISTLYIGLFALLYLFAPQAMLWPYSWGSRAEDFADLQSQVIVLLRFVAVYSFFDAMLMVFSSATRGAGDTRFALIFSLVSGLLVLILPTLVAGELGNQSLLVPWAAATAFVAVDGCGFLWRFQQGRWKTMRVIEPAARAVNAQ